MSEILLTKDQEGRVAGLRAEDARAWLRFRDLLRDLSPGDIIGVRTWFPRNRKFHRMHFAMLRRLLEAQEAFENPDALRAWAYVGAGHVHWIPSTDGVLTPVPKSVSFDAADNEEFRSVHERVIAFLRSERALVTLWPHLGMSAASEMIEHVIDGAD